MPIQISLKKSTTDPNGASGLTLGEPVFNYSNNTFWMGLGGSTAPVWIGAGICGASAAISSGTAYTVPSASAVRDYFIGVSGSFLPSTTGYVSSFNGRTGAVQGVSSAAAGTGISISAATGSVTITNTGVLSFNGLTGTLQGVSSAVAGTGISVSGATGAVTITNIGVQSFNGSTGAVQGVSDIDGVTGSVTSVAKTNIDNAFSAEQTINTSGNSATIYENFISWYNDTTGFSQVWNPSTLANSTITFPSATTTLAGLDVNQTFTGLNTFTGGLCASAGITFNGIFSGATATFSRITTHNAGLTTSFLFASSGSTFGSTLQVNGGATLASTLDVTGVARFAGGVTFSGTTDHAGVNRFAGGVTFSGTVDAAGVVRLNAGVTASTVDVSGAARFASTTATTGLASFAGGISAAGGITFGATAAFNNSIVLQNSEFIRNTTDGRMDFMPAPSSSTAYGVYMDFTSWTFGPRFGTIKSSDNTKNNASILWDAPLVVANDTAFSLGSSQAYKFYMASTGNDTLQAAVPAGVAGYSSALALVDYAQIGAANRSPITAHTNPNLYIYSAGAANANDFVRIEHDRTNGRIVSGGTSGISIEPGNGLLGISGGISASGGTTLASTLDVTGVARFAGGVTFSGTTDHAGVNRFTGGATFAGQVNATTFKLNTVGGDEGGQIDFGLAATNTTLTTGVAIDIYQNKLRFFESGGNNRGAYIDLTATANSVGSNLDGGAQGYAGLTTGVPTYTYPDGVTTYNSGKQLFYQPVYSINDQSGFTVYANRTYFSLFNVGKATTIKTIQIVPANTVTTGNCHLSIYDADPTTGLPKTRLWSSASIAVGSGYTKTTASPNYTVPAGYFYLAASFSSTPIMYSYQRTYSLPVFGAPDLTSGYRGYYFVADTNGFTAPAAIPTAGVTFALVDYTTANYAGVRIEFAV